MKQPNLFSKNKARAAFFTFMMFISTLSFAHLNKDYTIYIGISENYLNFVDEGELITGQTNGDLTFLSTKQAMAATPGLQSLLNDLQPTLYLNADGINKYGTTDPVVAFCTPATIARLYEENPAYASVRVITIRIAADQKDLALDIAKLSSFYHLEYIQLIFEYDVCGGESTACLLNKAEGMVTIGEKPLTILYQLSIPQ